MNCVMLTLSPYDQSSYNVLKQSNFTKTMFVSLLFCLGLKSSIEEFTLICSITLTYGKNFLRIRKNFNVEEISYNMTI